LQKDVHQFERQRRRHQRKLLAAMADPKPLVRTRQPLVVVGQNVSEVNTTGHGMSLSQFHLNSGTLDY